MTENISTVKKHSTDSGVTVLKINNHKFVVGLRWHTLKSAVHFMREARQFGKDNDMDIVVIREGLVTQGGFVSKSSGVTKEMYSVGSALVDIIGSSFLAIFQLDDDQYYLLAANDNAVIPDSDIIGDKDRIYQRMVDLHAMFEWEDEHIIAPDSWSYGGQEKSLESLLIPANIKKKHRLKQLTFGLSKKEWIRYSILAGLLVALGIGVFIYNQQSTQLERQRLAALQDQRRAELDRLSIEQRQLIESSSLTRPWTLKPQPHKMLELCQDAIYSLPITIGGWVFMQSKCTPTRLDATYKRSPGATNLSFTDEFELIFPDNAVHASIADDEEASFNIGMTMPAAGDEINQLTRTVRNTFVSHFQKIDHQIKVDQIPSISLTPAILPNGMPWPTGEEPPAPTWNTYAFVFESADQPLNAIAELPKVGFRVAIVEASFNENNASFSWKTVGEIYGSR